MNLNENILLAVGFVFGAVVGMSAIVLLGPWESGELAAWVQAIGAIVGIAIAVIVPWRLQTIQRLELQKRRELDALIFANSILSEIVAFGAHVDSSLAAFDSMAVDPIRDGMRLLNLKIAAPTALQTATDRFSVFEPDLGIPLARAISISNMFDNDVEYAFQNIAQNNVTFQGGVAAIQKLRRNVEMVRECLDEANEAIGRLQSPS